jgi:hypothetical protein
MKFKNINSGVILTPSNNFVIEQLKKSKDYVEVKEQPKKEVKKDKNETTEEVE